MSGILVIPESMKPAGAAAGDDFEKTLMDAMLAPIADKSDASLVGPIIMYGDPAKMSCIVVDSPAARLAERWSDLV